MKPSFSPFAVGPFAVVVLTYALLFGCGTPEAQVSQAQVSQAQAPPASGPSEAITPPGSATPVILISIDTLRSDRLPAYGYKGVQTPHIDRLRSDGILFERAYAHTPLTLPSHVSVFTGLLPTEHGVRDNQGYAYKPGEFPSLTRRLKDRGYAVGGAVSSYVLHRQSGFGSEDFDFFDDAVVAEGSDPEAGDFVALGGVSRRGDATLEAVTPWLRQVAEEPFCLFFHLFEPHLPRSPPEPFASRYPSPYDGEVAAADHIVGQLLDLLTELGVYQQALIVLFSDHGEGLGDHGEEEHGILLYREALQVPWIMKLPDQRRAGDTIPNPVQLIDIFPTVIDALGLPPEPGLVGLSRLDPEAKTDKTPKPIYGETYYPRIHYGWSDLTSMIDDRYHYIHGPDPELYDLLEDPQETNNLLPKQRRAAEDLRLELELFNRPLEAPTPVDEETRARLAALGYAGGSARVLEGPLPDPKTQLPTLANLRRGFDLVRQGQPEEALEVFKRLLRANPQMVDGWQALGDTAARLGHWNTALGAYGKVVELSHPDGELVLQLVRAQLEYGQWAAARDGIRQAELLGTDVTAPRRQLGLALAEAGRAQEAMAELGPLVEQQDPVAMNGVALLLSRQGRQGEALALLERTLAIAPNHAQTHENLSLVYLHQQRWQSARDAARRALDTDPERPQAWNNLGVASFMLKQPSEALEAWQRAVELDPQQFDTLFNLGTKAAELGHRDLARRALTRFIDEAPADTYGADLQKARFLLHRLGS